MRSESKTVYYVVIARFKLDKQFRIEEINSAVFFFTRI